MEIREKLKVIFDYWFSEYMDLKEELDSQIESGAIEGERLQQALKEINAAQDLIRYIISEFSKEEGK